MDRFKQNKLNALQMTKITGARTKEQMVASDTDGNCLTLTFIDNNDGSIRKIKMKEC